MLLNLGLKKNLVLNIVKDSNDIQGLRARELIKNAGVNIPLTGAGIPKLVEFQRYFNTQYSVVVYEYGRYGTVIFEGARGSNLPRLNLLHHSSHFSTIKSLPAAFSSKFFCMPCHKPFNLRGGHRCENIYPCCCISPGCSRNEVSLLCNKCNRSFRGQQCFNNHARTICNLKHSCPKCLKTYKVSGTKRQHVCGEIFCNLCKEYKERNHKCYIRKDHQKKKSSKHLFIYYDFETRQENIINNNKVHEVNLCVIQQSCSDCSDESDLKKICNFCGIRQHIFNEKAIERFVQYVLLPRTSFQTVTCIAHNSKSFDCQFILKHVTEVMGLTPKLILNGTKILLMEINYKVRFIDSLSYLPMKLSALPKAMDLPASLKKGYFPHFFNTRANEFYIGPLPSVDYYGVDSMSTTDRKDFLIWHEEQTNNSTVFRMESEIIDYCVSDVTILRLACEKFRNTFIQDCKVCPFTEAVTIVSACKRVFRRQFLKTNTIGIIPPKGYRMTENQSKIAIMWLIREENMRSIRIEHAGHGKESVLMPN